MYHKNQFVAFTKFSSLKNMKNYLMIVNDNTSKYIQYTSVFRPKTATFLD